MVSAQLAFAAVLLTMPADPSAPGAGGVVVEEVDPGSVLAAAGLQAGDELTGWRTATAGGDLVTPFDWMGLEVEHAHRGPVRLLGRRGGRELALRVPVGEWNVHFNSEKRPRSRVRPRLAPGDRGLQCWLDFRAGVALGEEAGLWGAAGERFEAALDAAAAPVERVFVLEALAKSYEYRSDNAGADRRYREALEIRRRVWGEESLHVARGHHQLASMAWGRGDLGLARTHFDRALQLRQRHAAGSYLEADSLHSQAILARELADLALAEDFIRRALEIQDRYAPRSVWAAFMRDTLGSVLALRGDDGQAEAELLRALAIREARIPVSIPTATTLANLGDLALRRGDLEAAATRHRWALDIRRRVYPDSLAVAHSTRSLAEIDLERRRIDAARRGFERALEIAERRAPGSLHVAAGLLGRGSVRAAEGDFTGALTAYREALEIQDRLAPGSEAQAVTLHRIGSALAGAGRTAEAADQLERALDSFERQIERLGGSDLVRGGFRAHRAYLYRDLLELQLRLGRPADAFLTLERYRAQSFLAALAERGLGVEMPAAARTRFRELRLLHDRALGRLADLSPERDAAEIERVRDELIGLHREIDLVLARHRRRGDRSQPGGRRPRPGIEELRRALDPGTSVLSYSVGPRRTHLLVLAADGRLRAETLEVAEAELERAVGRFIAACREPGRYPPRTAAREALGASLYTLLIAPFEGLLDGAERLLILPDGPLHALPWDALVRTGESADGAVASPLLAWKPVHLALSATVFAELRKRSRPRDGALRLVAFGDPLYPSRDHGEPRRPDDPRLRNAARRGFELDPLPHSRTEVESIAALYPGRARTFLGAQATEEAVLSAAPGADVVHVAAHGLLDERIPLNSGVALTLVEEVTPRRENGLLQAWEMIERLRLDASLVVLSACRTGLGRDLAGEGLIGLTRALQLAGARSVVASLWRVSDRATAELMTGFHRRLREGMTKDEALRAAKLDLMRGTGGSAPAAGGDAEFREPFYWAAFQLYGDPF